MSDYAKDELVSRERPDIETTLNALRDGEENESVPTTVFYGLSGLQPQEIEPLALVWDSLAPDYRRHVVSELAEAAETNFDLDYDVLGLFALEDDDDSVREAAVNLLWENESIEVMDRLIRLAEGDEVIPVRAAAMSALGHFILQGEVGDLPANETARAQNAAIRALTNPHELVEVRRRALEAISNSSHELVASQIEQAYRSDEQRMRVSAVFAMGRTCDETWGDEVLEALQSDDSEMRYEAARAAGELMLEDAIKHLRKVVFEDDHEVKEVAIWALGEIGGAEPMRILQRLAKDAEEREDEELLEAIEDALGSASLGSSQLYMMRLDD